jgi:hypothetical protein
MTFTFSSAKKPCQADSKSARAWPNCQRSRSGFRPANCPDKARALRDRASAHITIERSNNRVVQAYGGG